MWRVRVSCQVQLTRARCGSSTTARCRESVRDMGYWILLGVFVFIMVVLLLAKRSRRNMQ